MVVVPEQYVINVLYENIYKISYNKYNHTFNGCCPICKEGDSWGKKKRFYYIPKKELAYCHNCGYSKKPLTFISDVTNKPLQDIISEIKNFDVEIDTFIKDNEQKEVKVKNDVSLPDDCINLFDPVQVDYYKDNAIVKLALDVIKSRRLNKGINKPDALYVTLQDKVHKNRLILPFYDKDRKIIFYQSRGLTKKDLFERPKYLSKVNSERSLYGIHNIDVNLDNVFIFEGPIDSYFVSNGIATCGITENTDKMFTALQKEQINFLSLYKLVYVLDNQYIDKAALNKSLILADKGESVFVWPEELKKFKDFNDICVLGKKDKIKPEFILKNTYSGLNAKLRLTKIKNS
jgi:hypothetical protein|tara:strand:+ start:7680 stop:8720 length:1041 start_codon:yes stop_codon:yes gene_type:complete